MNLIEWRDEFKIGIDEVDFEHQELIELINEIYDEAKTEGSILAVSDSLGDIFGKISAHFALEEKEMRELNYDQYEVHKEDHEQLLDSIRDIMDEYEEENNLDEEDFGNRLKDWFVNHFSTKDARLHKFLQH
ncbi:MAG: hemerythrin family protein [Proteobacteria bacterium]|nr:hemerythrin-like metal-binding protein [Pseudomonadota bacterium]NOG61565.1 hemerythrin family protein [Pseudomonadota bacterium]